MVDNSGGGIPVSFRSGPWRELSASHVFDIDASLLYFIDVWSGYPGLTFAIIILSPKV